VTITKVDLIMGLLFPQKSHEIMMTKESLGYILGDFFHKIIWSPCSEVTVTYLGMNLNTWVCFLHPGKMLCYQCMTLSFLGIERKRQVCAKLNAYVHMYMEVDFSLLFPRFTGLRYLCIWRCCCRLICFTKQTYICDFVLIEAICWVNLMALSLCSYNIRS
jgi:hypothetical protein